MARKSWHPAFVQAIQHELKDYREDLTFESEHQLLTEPLRIDVLIIKKKRNVVIKKNIAQIFRRFNVIEYKSPADSVTIEAYHKTQSYGRLYASLNRVDINDVSITVVSTHRPRKLLAFLNERYTVTHVMAGIYLVSGDTCATQVLVSRELPEQDNLWLNGLRGGLTAEQLERLALSNEQGLPMDAFFQVVGEANIEALEDLSMRKKEGVILSEKLDALFREKYGATFIAEGEARGKAEGKAEGGRNTVLAVLRARFKRVPKEIEQAIFAMSDPIALESWAVHAVTCQSLDEFSEAVR